MPSLRILEELTPTARVATAVVPFVTALLIRLAFGRSRPAGLLITASTLWFTVNVLLAPYSSNMQRDFMDLLQIFR